MKCPQCNGTDFTRATRLKPGIDPRLVEACVSGVDTLMENGHWCNDCDFFLPEKVIPRGIDPKQFIEWSEMPCIKNLRALSASDKTAEAILKRLGKKMRGIDCPDMIKNGYCDHSIFKKCVGGEAYKEKNEIE